MRAYLRSIRKQAGQNSKKFLNSHEIRVKYADDIDLIKVDIDCRVREGFIFTDGTMYYDTFDDMYEAHSYILNYFMLNGFDITGTRNVEENSFSYFIKF